jgi:hypothetical protein
MWTSHLALSARYLRNDTHFCTSRNPTIIILKIAAATSQNLVARTTWWSRNVLPWSYFYENINWQRIFCWNWSAPQTSESRLVPRPLTPLLLRPINLRKRVDIKFSNLAHQTLLKWHFFFMAERPLVGQGLLITEALRSQTHHTR